MNNQTDWKIPDEIIEEVVFTESDIQQKVRDLGRQITETYRGRELIVIGILRGAFVFMADLIRHLDLPMTVDFMLVSSYEGTETSGHVRIIKDTKASITDRDVLVVEDIVDSGLTYASLRETLLTREPSSLKICTLLNKPDRRRREVPVDFSGFEVGNRFLVGYGLDYQEYHRSCPFIFVPTEEALTRLDEP